MKSWVSYRADINRDSEEMKRERDLPHLVIVAGAFACSPSSWFSSSAVVWPTASLASLNYNDTKTLHSTRTDMRAS